LYQSSSSFLACSLSSFILTCSASSFSLSRSSCSALHFLIVSGSSFGRGGITNRGDERPSPELIPKFSIPLDIVSESTVVGASSRTTCGGDPVAFVDSKPNSWPKSSPSSACSLAKKSAAGSETGIVSPAAGTDVKSESSPKASILSINLS
jgi:hypothetical protein